MKRYQCIKDFYMSDGRLAFKAGRIYQSQTEDFPLRFKSELTIGYAHAMYKEDAECFHELLDLHVDDIPRDEADREPFTTPEPRRKLTAGWAWFIALVITIVFFILKAFTE